jgi:opacity protein-like surface antigen
VRSLFLALALCTAAPALAAAPVEEPIETPIAVPTTVPVGFLLAWKPTVISVRIANGAGAQFGSDRFEALRGLGRYTTTLLGEKLLARAEIEGGKFQTDTQGTHLGSNGFDLTARLLGGTATRISQSLTITASGGLITRYQRGTEASGGAPRIGVLGLTSNLEAEVRVAPVVTFSAYLEGGLTPIPYGAQPNLGVLQDASELRLRVQLSIDVSSKAAIDVGYDFTRWHASFSGTSVLGNPNPDQALLLEAREQAITLGIRWKP